jgi:DTW domain-containing protein YfiP
LSERMSAVSSAVVSQGVGVRRVSDCLYVRYSCTCGNIRMMKLGVVSVVLWVFG